MRDRILSFNPACQVTCIEEFVEPGNWPALLPQGVTAVIDACDQVKAKTAMAVWARNTQTLFISVGAAGGKRQAHLVDIDDLTNTTHDPLLAQLRYRLRKAHDAPRQGKKIGVTCVFSREAVKAPDASCAVEGDGTLNCHGYGSVVSVTATFGQCAAGWILDRLAG
jgi:tRNA A37 threonylcarbamoyladenosine dehydratase